MRRVVPAPAAMAGLDGSSTVQATGLPYPSNSSTDEKIPPAMRRVGTRCTRSETTLAVISGSGAAGAAAVPDQAGQPAVSADAVHGPIETED